MLARIEAGPVDRAGHLGVGGGGADRGQGLRISLERESIGDQLLAKVARGQRAARHGIAEADALIAAGEEPEVVALADMLLAIHPAEAGTFGLELVDIGRLRIAD